MDYREHLTSRLSKHFVDILVAEVIMHPDDFDLVYQLIYDKDIKVAWRAAWACHKISEKEPKWFGETHFNGLVDLAISTKHGGLQRGCLSILYNIQLPDNIPVPFINACFKWMTSHHCPIAVQSLSIKLLYRICLKEPDFVTELKATLENINPEDYSTGFICARKRTLKLLSSNNFNLDA